ncbi:MAG: hypothetical protein JW953_22425 [Anaerolineae bacterium]|nr:hypothetical protein [Anaerolineae bacterium]
MFLSLTTTLPVEKATSKQSSGPNRLPSTNAFPLGQRGPLTGSVVYKVLKNYAFRAGLDPDLVIEQELASFC